MIVITLDQIARHSTLIAFNQGKKMGPPRQMTCLLWLHTEKNKINQLSGLLVYMLTVISNKENIKILVYFILQKCNVRAYNDKILFQAQPLILHKFFTILHKLLILHK